MSTALAKREEQTKTIKASLEKAKGSIAAVAAKHLTPDRLLKVALAAAQRQPKLLECTPTSLVRAVVGCAELGLEPNALGHAYLVPYKNEATLIIGYKGLLQLAYRSGMIQSITAECVFEGDEFDHDLGAGWVKHKTNGETDPQKIVCAYAIITMKDGGRTLKVMHRKAIDRIKNTKSKSGNNGPWVSDYEEMARKTVLRNALKYAPMSIEMVKAEAADQYADSGDVADLGDFEWIEAEESETEEPEKGTAALKGKIADPGNSETEEYQGKGVDEQGNLIEGDQ